MNAHRSDVDRPTPPMAAVDITSDGSDTEPDANVAEHRSGPRGPRRLWLALAGVVALLVAAALLFPRLGSDSDAANASAASTPVPGVDGDTAGDVAQDSATTLGGSGIEDAPGTTSTTEELDGIAFPSSSQWLAAQRGVAIALIDPSDGSERSFPLPGTASGQNLATIDGRLVYVHGASAWAVSADGEAEPIGAADVIRDSANLDRVWLGIEGARTGVPGTSENYVDWVEVDATGGVYRTTPRETLMEFPQPDLIWGFNGSVYRLSDRDLHPWRFVAQGFPVAVGMNDVVLNICTSDRQCDRKWYDAQTGVEGGPVLGDVADQFIDRYGGTLSPSGRFISHENDTGLAEIRSVASAKIVAQGCVDSNAIAWAEDDVMLACATLSGLLVVDLQRELASRLSIEIPDAVVWVDPPTPSG